MVEKPLVIEGSVANWLFGIMLAIAACVGGASMNPFWGFAAFLICGFVLILVSVATQKIIMEIRTAKEIS